jgi:glycosyltransferase involved in cell wall biosynthesis
MHILMLSDFETQGGAAIAASRLAEALCQAGHRITRVLNMRDGEEHLWMTRPLASMIAPAAPSLMERVGWRLMPFKTQHAWEKHETKRQIALALEKTIAMLNPDCINIHNLHGSVNAGWTPDLIRICHNYAPVIWTLHDMWSFTGRCVYSYDCKKFIFGCDQECPTPTEYPALEPHRIAEAWDHRRRLLAACPRLTAVAPSHWLAGEARSGLWQKHKVEVIPYGLPLDVYRPLDRGVARAALGIDAEGPVLLAAAMDLADRRKGGDFLVNALKNVAHHPLTIVTLGKGRLKFEANGMSVHHLGYVDHERTRVLAYNAADLFIHPAPVDNLPNVVVEAIACGTPVVAFPIGGLPEMVRPNETGWLAKELSSAALVEAIHKAIAELPLRDWRASCRSVAEAEYPAEIQAKRYTRLFQSLAARGESR